MIENQEPLLDSEWQQMKQEQVLRTSSFDLKQKSINDYHGIRKTE